MKIRKKIKNLGAGLLAAVLLALTGVWTAAFPVQAASGNVYTCVIHPCYAHPVTGQIEDSGGEASYATGQGMVEGVVYTTGILELTDSGEYYLTVRFSLMDQTSGHSFWVQNVGDSGWASPAVGITGNGTDGNGSTADICMQVPSENCVVRCSMYVGPMGRDVVFYLYPSDYTAGNNTNMNATMVTASSGSQATSSGGSVSGEAASSAGSSSGLSSGGNASLSAAGGLSETDNSENSTENGDSETPELSSSIDQAADPSDSTDTELNDAQGLSLSTAEDAGEETNGSGGGGAGHVAAVAAAVTVSALVLMGAASLIVYFFRRNWKRWGGGYDDDEV
ncbi:MAG: heme-binding Shp domain-containing protein [Merdimonas faecis]|uniref:heme-binding Shp domain-containing protein n=1 Tax=Merdimonas faecis TaxID=1653435 RepID=UPI0039908A12